MWGKDASACWWFWPANNRWFWKRGLGTSIEKRQISEGEVVPFARATWNVHRLKSEFWYLVFIVKFYLILSFRKNCFQGCSNMCYWNKIHKKLVRFCFVYMVVFDAEAVQENAKVVIIKWKELQIFLVLPLTWGMKIKKFFKNKHVIYDCYFDIFQTHTFK